MADWQTIALVPLVLLAAGYVARSLWASVRPQRGCASCSQNPGRVDDWA